MRRVSFLSLDARIAASLARPGPGQSSCFNITQLGIALMTRRITEVGNCTPEARG